METTQITQPTSPAPLRELERMSGMPSDPTLLALEALYRGDSVGARNHLRTPPVPARESDMEGVSLWGFANGDTRPLTAEVLFQLGEYQATVDLLRPFQPDQLMGRQFDPRWALVGRVRVLRGLALERLGQRTEAALEFSASLAQWMITPCFLAFVSNCSRYSASRDCVCAFMADAVSRSNSHSGTAAAMRSRFSRTNHNALSCHFARSRLATN